MVNEAPAGLKDVRSRLVLDTNASDERCEALITWNRRNSLQVDKSTLNQRLLSSVAENRLRPAEGRGNLPRPSRWKASSFYGQGPGPGVKSKKPETVPLNCDERNRPSRVNNDDKVAIAWHDKRI